MGKFKITNFTHNEVLAITESFKKSALFIASVLKDFPHSGPNDSDDEKEVVGPSNKISKPLPARLCPARAGGKTHGRTVEDLQAKLSLLKGKPSLAYKDKLLKKGLKNRLKKKEKKEMKRTRRIEAKSAKKVNGVVVNETKPAAKPVYNSEGNLVFSKFDFSELGAKAKRKSKGPSKDPKIALKKVREQENRLKQLEEEGMKEKVAEIKEKKAWKTALLKSEGVKVKDNPELLKATIKKVKKRKEKSEARWKASQKKLEKEKEEKQQKRLANIQARSREKKLKKMKAMSKRGKLIAGF